MQGAWARASQTSSSTLMGSFGIAYASPGPDRRAETNPQRMNKGSTMHTSAILESLPQSQELGLEWSDLTNRVRARLSDSEATLRHQPESHGFHLLAVDVRSLCDRFDRLHLEVHRLLSDYQGATSHGPETTPPIDPASLEQASVAIQREQHTQSSGPMEVLKALFLWRENPEERARGNQLSDTAQSAG